jgi:hypothetical protein
MVREREGRALRITVRARKAQQMGGRALRVRVRLGMVRKGK